MDVFYFILVNIGIIFFFGFTILLGCFSCLFKYEEKFNFIVFKVIIRNNDLWNIFFNKKFFVLNISKLREGCCYFLYYLRVRFSFNWIKLEGVKGERKKRNLRGIKFVKLCSVIVRVVLEIYLEIIVFVFELL